MHDAARDWVKANWVAADTIVDVGGRNVNYGTVRSMWPDAKSYTSIDLHPGEGVDWVGDFNEYWPDADRSVDLVICMEVLEHVNLWEAIVRHASEILHPGHGVLLVTAASLGRRPHSGYDGGPLRDDEWYLNIEPDGLARTLNAYFDVVQVDTGPGHPLALERPQFPGDVYAKAGYPK